MQNPHNCSPPLNYDGEFQGFQSELLSGNTRKVTSATSGTRFRAKPPNRQSRKISDHKYRMRKKRDFEASEYLIKLLIFTLKTFLHNFPTSLNALLSMFWNEAAFRSNISGEVTNQLPQQNGKQMQDDQMQNLAGVGGRGAGIPLSGSHANIFAMDHELQRPRLNMHEIEIILQLLSQPVVNEAHQKQKLKEIYERIGEGLLKSAQTNDEYINQNTFESHLSNLNEQFSINSYNQRHVQLVNSSSSVGTMIPIPGMSHSGNSNLMASSLDTTMLRTGGIHGNLSIGYEQSPANFATSSVGNTSLIGVQRMTSTMIPTPGFNDNNKSHCYMNMESSNNGTGGHSSFEFMEVSQPEQQNQFVGSQNSLILHTLGSQMSNNLTSMMQQRPYGFLDGAREMIENMQLLNEPAGAEFESNLMNEVSAETIETVNYQEYEAQLTQVLCFGEETGKPEPCDLSTANASRMWGGQSEKLGGE